MIDKTDPTNRDTVPAMLTPGEFVLNKEATEMYGPIIQQMNNNGLQQRSAENKAMEANMGGGVKYYNDGSEKPVSSYKFEPTMKKLVQDLMKDFGLTKLQASAMAGNLGWESDNFKGMQEYNPIVKGSKGGYGFAQWTGPRREMFEEWSKSNNLDPSSYDANYGFLKFELSNSNDEIGNMGVNTIDQLKKSNDLNEATSIVMNTYLKPKIPHEDKRQSRSQSVFDLFKSDNNNEVVTSVRPQTRPESIPKESQPVVMEQPPVSLPNSTGYGGYTPQQFLDEAGRMNTTTTVPSMEQAPPMMQEFIAPLPNAGADASFGSAFKEARGQMGAGQVFDYGGKQYTTNFAEEEDMMTANMGGKACSCGKKKVCDCGLSMTYANMGGDIPTQYLNIGDFVRNLMSPFYQKEDKKYLGYGTEPYPYDTVATYPAVTAPGDQGMGVPPAPNLNDPNAGYANYSQQDFLNEANKVNDIVAQPEGYKMPFELPKVNSDQSILDGSSDSVKDAQRMMMLNNPIPNVMPKPDGNPTSLAPPSVDFLPMKESFKGVSIPRSEQDAERMMGINNPMSTPLPVPQSVQDSKRMIDINADNAFIPKVPALITDPSIEKPEYNPNKDMVLNSNDGLIEYTDEGPMHVPTGTLISDLEDDQLNALSTWSIDAQKEIASRSNKQFQPAIDLVQNKVNQGIRPTETEIKAAELANQRKLEMANAVTVMEDYEEDQSRLTKEIKEREIKRQERFTEERNSRLKEAGITLPAEKNILGEAGRSSPYQQYGDMVQSRIDALEKSTEPEGSPSNNTNNTTTTTQTDSESIESLGNQIAKETKNTSQVTEAKGLLSSVFGDLFDSKELMRAAIMYLGGRATGMTGNQALAFAGKTYLAREEANDTAMKKHINKLITDGDYTTASIKLYKETGDIDVLQPKGATYVDLGETKTYYPISGKMKGVAVQARKVKGSDGSIKWQGQNGQFLSLNKYHTDINRSKSRPRSAINAEVAQVEKLFTSLRDDYGTVKTAQGGESAVYRTRLNPRLVGEKTVDWAMSNNIPPYAVGEVLEGAYKRALADAARENKPLIAESIDGYLHSQWIQMSAGDVTDFMTGDEKNPKPIETTAVNEWVGGIKSKVSAVNPKEFEGMNDIVFSTFLRESKLTDSYRNTEANGGISLKDRQTYIRRANAQTPPISGYMLYMQENVAKEYRLLLDKRSQVTS